MLLQTLFDSTRRHESQKSLGTTRTTMEQHTLHDGLLLQDPSLEHAVSVSERRRGKAGPQ